MSAPAKTPVPPAPAPGGPPQVDIDSMLAFLDAPPAPNPEAPPTPAAPAAPARNPTATLPPGTPLKNIPRLDERPTPDRAAVPPTIPIAALDVLLAEVRAVRRLQEEIVGLLRAGRAAAPVPDMEVGDEPGLEPGFAALEEVLDGPPAPAPVRSRRSKTVLVIDDDPGAREEVVSALDRALVPVRTATNGSAGLAAIAEEKPDVIVLELDLKGSMAGKDVVNMIKATMEWVDIPLVLYTRAAITNQKEARTIHGADEFVLKGPGSAEALVATIVSAFRRT